MPRFFQYHMPLPLDGLVRPPDLSPAEAGLTPELRDPVHARKNPVPMYLPSGSRAQQQAPGGLQVTNQRAHAFHLVSRHPVLLSEHVERLRIVFVGKLNVMRFLNHPPRSSPPSVCSGGTGFPWRRRSPLQTSASQFDTNRKTRV